MLINSTQIALLVSEPSVHILIVYRSALHRFAAADFLNREWAILWDK